MTASNVQNTSAHITSAIITNAQETETQDALRTLYDMYGNGLPSWEDCATSDMHTAYQRAIGAITLKAQARRDEANAEVKGAIDAILCDKVGEALTKYEEDLALFGEDKEEYDNMSERAKARTTPPALPVRPTSVSIALSEVVGLFPTNTPEPTMTRQLGEMSDKGRGGFFLGKGAKGTYIIRKEIPAV